MAVSYDGKRLAVRAPDNKVWRDLGEVIPPQPNAGGRDTDPSKGLFLGNAFKNSKSDRGFVPLILLHNVRLKTVSVSFVKIMGLTIPKTSTSI